MNDNFDETEVVERITNNYTYGTDFLLLLEVSDGIDYRNYVRFLDKYGITGKRLEAYYKVCFCDPEYINDTKYFLEQNFVSKNDIVRNLDSKKPIPFITELFEFTYDSYLNDDQIELARKSFISRLNRKRR